jgi:high affinity Mn2+ porin
MRATCSRALAHGKLARAGAVSLLVALTLEASPAGAQAAPPAPHDDATFDVMNVLAEHGLHDLEDESWNAYGQFTYISSWKRPFSAAYTNRNGTINSLSPEAERSFTGSFTLFLGARLWSGAEAYLVPEVIAERPLSTLRGLGGAIQNFELQKTGAATPQLYRARAFVRQTIDLGGDRVEKTSDPMQLAAVVGARRLVLTVGNFTILDMLDRNSVTGDPRQTFFNIAFMTHAAYDFASDARGYSWGGVAELYWDDFALRLGRVIPPKHPNQLALDFRIDQHYGDQIELERTHRLFGRAGAVRLLAYRNQESMARFDDAIALLQADPSKSAAGCRAAAAADPSLFSYFSPDDAPSARTPDVCWARRENVKVGIGLNVEQRLTDDVGVFFRGMYSDGQTEVYSYTSADRSVSAGVVARGAAWHRPFDVVGVGAEAAWISAAHARYLKAGGIDGFVGDGDITPGAESVLEAFYSVNVLRALWLSADYQRITNPAFNRDRGPVDIFGGRVHAEF